MNKPNPLTKRTMTLNALQLETLDVIRKVKFQLRRAAHEDGMSDAEFIEQVLDPLQTTIHQDRHVQRMRRKERQKHEDDYDGSI